MLKLEDIYGTLPTVHTGSASSHTNIEADVTVAKDGQEAFELVKESMEQHKLFNLIFMDIQVSLSPRRSLMFVHSLTDSNSRT